MLLAALINICNIKKEIKIRSRHVLEDKGVFHLVAKIIRELKSHMISINSLVEITAFRLESKLPPMRALEFIRDHVTFKLPYDFSYQMKTPNKSVAYLNPK